jgi:hypothetical protein
MGYKQLQHLVVLQQIDGYIYHHVDYLVLCYVYSFFADSSVLF